MKLFLSLVVVCAVSVSAICEGGINGLLEIHETPFTLNNPKKGPQTFESGVASVSISGKKISINQKQAIPGSKKKLKVQGKISLITKLQDKSNFEIPAAETDQEFDLLGVTEETFVEQVYRTETKSCKTTCYDYENGGYYSCRGERRIQNLYDKYSRYFTLHFIKNNEGQETPVATFEGPKSNRLDFVREVYRTHCEPDPRY